MEKETAREKRQLNGFNMAATWQPDEKYLENVNGSREQSPYK